MCHPVCPVLSTVARNRKRSTTLRNSWRLKGFATVLMNEPTSSW